MKIRGKNRLEWIMERHWKRRQTYPDKNLNDTDLRLRKHQTRSNLI